MLSLVASTKLKVSVADARQRLQTQPTLPVEQVGEEPSAAAFQRDVDPEATIAMDSREQHVA